MLQPRPADSVIARVPGWSDATRLAVEPLPGGWTNQTFAVAVGTESFVLRVASAEAILFGANRLRERQIQAQAARAGLTPEAIYFGMPEGDLVTRRLPGRVWCPGEPVDAERIRRTANLVTRIHALDSAVSGYSPFRAIEACAAEHSRRGGAFPASVEHALRELGDLETALTLIAGAHCVCHHDLSVGNFVEGETLQVLDWEYAALGDPFFDFAAVAIAHGYDVAQQADWLSCVADPVDEATRSRFSGMKRVYDLREATWSLLMRTLRGPNDVLARELDESVELFSTRLASGSP